jgi:adenylate kinase family enzyme
MQRINVIGTSGSGKSTFSQKLAQHLNSTYLELDELHWADNWVERSQTELCILLEERISKYPNWVLDGNYQSQTWSIKQQHIDTLIWLDYSFFTTLYRITKRSFLRAFRKNKLWKTTNFETFSKLFSSDSMIWWVLQTYCPNKRKYEQLFSSLKQSPIKCIRLHSPKEAEAFLTTLEHQQTA